MKPKWIIIAVVVIIGFVSFPTFKLAFTGLKLAKTTQKTILSATSYAQNIFSDNNKIQETNVLNLKNDLGKLDPILNSFINQSQKSWLAEKIIKDQFELLSTTQDLIFIAQKLLEGKHRYVLLFQNSEEIRATGGFLGSYAKIELKDGLLTTFEIQDIYVPDGQFNWFIQAPAGAKEFLSGGDGLRLRDANWHPDFPTSAQQILNYFAWGKEDGLDGAVAINLPIVEKILSITGPIYISDYDQTVTDKNFSDIARADRNEFFPGSQQKQHFLSTFFNQLIIKLQNLDKDQQQLLVKKIIASAQRKDIQFFSNNSDLQHFFEKLQISGQLISQARTTSLMLVESNVGINKANQHVDRGVKINLEKTLTQVEVSFTNHNFPPSEAKKKNDEADHLTYVNYQRIIVPTDFNVKNIIFNNSPVENWNEEIITNSKNESFKQIGFLITIPEQSSSKLEINLTHPEQSHPESIWLQKQAGLSPIPHTVLFQDQTKNFDLVKDTLVEFTP